MSMQEFEQENVFQPEQGIRAENYQGSYEVGQQKIYPVERQRQSNVFPILFVVFSSIGFAPSILGIVGSAIVLRVAQNAHDFGFAGYQALITGGVLGLVGSILALLLFVTTFILSLIFLILRQVASRRGFDRSVTRGRNMGNTGW